MDVIEGALRDGLDGIAAGPITDPAAARHLVQAGAGAEVELPVGGGVDFC
jgi:microcystin degradation protein MlrC